MTLRERGRVRGNEHAGVAMGTSGEGTQREFSLTPNARPVGGGGLLPATKALLILRLSRQGRES